ncbi:MAG: LptF/LptG family permease [Pseudomonadota bacterium]
MRSLDLYIFRQCVTPLTISIVVVTAIVWMTQSLQRIDLIVEHGQGFAMFGWLSILIIPSLLTVVIPFAIFGATLYTLQRLHADSEIAVIFAAGVSRWRIAAPLMAITFAAAAATLWINLDLMPRSYRTLKLTIADIRADFASTVLRGGEFTTVVDGLTIYAEVTRPGGQFEGLLISDYRNGDSPETYMAQKGLLRESPQGPILYLANGNIQRIDEQTGDVDFIKFQETAVNVSNLNEGRGAYQLELTERYLSELFNPDMTNDWDRKFAGKLIAEGHNRLSSPLYAFSYLFIALFALIGGAYNRRGYAIRIAVACSAAGAIRIFGFVIQGAAAETGVYWPMYALPVGVVIVLAALLSGLLTRRRAAAPALAASEGVA